jgi:hypothetical protein
VIIGRTSLAWRELCERQQMHGCIAEILAVFMDDDGELKIPGVDLAS